MKVWIGPYSKWWSTSRLEDWMCSKVFGVQYDFEVSDQDKLTWKYKAIENTGDALQTVLNYTFNPVFRWYGRREIVHIDHYDIWNMDNTLAMIILPMLEKLAADKTGTPGVYVEDIPSWMLVEAYKENIDTVGPEHEKYPSILFSDAAWQYVIKEMIFAFKQSCAEWSNEDCMESKLWDKYQRGDMTKSNWILLSRLNGERVQRGFVLFGKYFQNMWT